MVESKVYKEVKEYRSKDERKILYVVNPVAGTLKKEALIKKIAGINKEKNISFEFTHSNANGNYTLLADRIVDEHFTDVVIIGGDGTVNHVVDALHHTNVQFGIIPYGSGNGLAYAACIPKKPLDALQLILNGTGKPTDAFRVNGHFSCMLSGIGFDAKVAHDFAQKASRGLLTYTQQSLLNYFKAHPYQFEVILDNFSFFTEAFFITIANSNQFGNNFTIAPHASLDDGLLDIVIVQKMNKARLPFAILRQIRGNNKLQKLVEDISQKTILYFQTTSLTIRNLKLAPFHVDGEPMDTSEELNASIIKDCFKLIRP